LRDLTGLAAAAGAGAPAAVAFATQRCTATRGEVIDNAVVRPYLTALNWKPHRQ
jgi:hypothetical protein